MQSRAQAQADAASGQPIGPPVSRPLQWHPGLWIAAGLGFLALNLALNAAPKSPLWPAELPLHALMIAGLAGWLAPLPLTRRTAPVAYMALCWVFGMIYESSLTVNGSGIGGMHPDTRASYVLAQGIYLPLALAGWLAVRWLRLDFRAAFFLAAGMSLAEGLFFTGVLTATILSPAAPLAPLMLAYYAVAYASFMALPLLLVDPALLWTGPPARRPLSIPAVWVAGFVLAFASAVIWGLGWAPLATRLFHLPPNLPGM